MTDNNSILDQLGKVGSTVESVFRLMEIAEEEIKEGKRKYPDHEKEIHELFLSMQGYNVDYSTYLEEIFRSHCRELVERVPIGESLSPPTNAEMLIGSMQFFTYAAPGRSGVGICQALFQRVIPKEKWVVTNRDGEVVCDFSRVIEPEWEDQFENEIGKMRRSSRTQVPQRDLDFRDCLAKVKTQVTYEEAYYQEALF